MKYSAPLVPPHTVEAAILVSRDGSISTLTAKHLLSWLVALGQLEKKGKEVEHISAFMNEHRLQ